ncbi:MAG: hypothetical protein D6723_02590, partial [Acidobacteria bacterium]
NGNLRLAWWDGKRWHVQIVDATEMAGNYTSLAFDAKGNPRISYFYVTDADLRFAWLEHVK